MELLKRLFLSPVFFLFLLSLLIFAYSKISIWIKKRQQSMEQTETNDYLEKKDIVHFDKSKIEYINKRLKRQTNLEMLRNVIIVATIIFCTFTWIALDKSNTATDENIFESFPAKLILFLFVAGVILLPIAITFIGKKMSKNFYNKWMPEIIGSVFADCNATLMVQPTKEFFSAPITYGSGILETYATAQPKAADCTIDAFFAIYRTYHRNYKKQERDRTYYSIKQRLVFNIHRNKMTSLNCTIDVREEMRAGITKMINKGRSNIDDAMDENPQQVAKKNVNLEDPEFEKYFEVKSDDQLASRMFLTPHQMQRLTEFRKIVGPFRVYYTDEKITVVFYDFLMMDIDGCRENGYPKCLRAETIHDCFLKKDLILNNLHLLWEE